MENRMVNLIHRISSWGKEVSAAMDEAVGVESTKRLLVEHEGQSLSLLVESETLDGYRVEVPPSVGWWVKRTPILLMPGILGAALFATMCMSGRKYEFIRHDDPRVRGVVVG